MKDKVNVALREFLKVHGWIAEIRSYTHPSDGAVTATLYRIKESKK